MQRAPLNGPVEQHIADNTHPHPANGSHVRRHAGYWWTAYAHLVTQAGRDGGERDTTWGAGAG